MNDQGISITDEELDNPDPPMSLKKEIYQALEKGLRSERGEPSAFLDDNGTLFVRASAAGTCPRALWYEAHGYTRLPFSLHTERAFQHGSERHDLIRKLLSKNGLSISMEEDEILIYEPGLVIRGHIDGVLSTGAAEYLFEFKTISAYGFKVLDAEGISLQYQIQATLYMRGLQLQNIGAQEALFLYEAKPDKTVPAIHVAQGVSHDTPLALYHVIRFPFVQVFYEETIKALQSLRGKEKPERLLEKERGRWPLDGTPQDLVQWPWQCTYCAFAETCRPEAKAVVRKSFRGNVKYETRPEKIVPYDSYVLVERQGDEREENLKGI